MLRIKYSKMIIFAIFERDNKNKDFYYIPKVIFKKILNLHIILRDLIFIEN